MFWSSCIFCPKLEANHKFAQNEENTFRMAQLETLNHINMHDFGLQKEMGSALNAARTAGWSAWRASRLHASQYLCSDERAAPSAHTDTCTFKLFVSSLPLASLAPFLKKQPTMPPSSAWNLMIVRRHNHQHREMGGKVMTPLLEINTAVQKTLHWFAPDLKGKSANIEISISGWLGYRAPSSYQATKRSTNILYSLWSNSGLYVDRPGALLWRKEGKIMFRGTSEEPLLVSVAGPMNHEAAQRSCIRWQNSGLHWEVVLISEL